MRHLGLLFFLLVSPVCAQEDFSALLEVAIDSERKEASPRRVQAAFAAALNVFLKLDLEDPQRAALIPRAGRAAFGTGRISMACDLLEEQRLAGKVDSFLVSWWCRAHLASGAVDATLRRAKAWDEEYPEAVGEFVLGASGGGSQRLLVGAGEALRRGDSSLGMWLFERVATGSNAMALANLALAQRHLDRLEASENNYRRALALAPEDSVLWNDFGLFLKGVGRLPEAWNVFLRSYRLEAMPGMGPAITNLLLLSRNGRQPWAGAEAAVEALLRLRPGAALARRLAIERILAEH